MKQFDDYVTDREASRKIESLPEIKGSSPIAYFSTEYGLHECLPILLRGSGHPLRRSSEDGQRLEYPARRGRAFFTKTVLPAGHR